MDVRILLFAFGVAFGFGVRTPGDLSNLLRPDSFLFTFLIMGRL